MATDSLRPLPIVASSVDPPSRDLDDRLDIRFLHPGYPSPLNVFLTLPRVDSESSDGAVVFGIHHQTALTACQITAGNVFQAGYFAADSAGGQKERVSLDGLLTKNSYYFIVDGNVKYPIVPSFKDWEFPHGQVPDLWPTISHHGPIAVDISVTCRMSGVSYAINRAHLVPQEESVWYLQNGMAVYGGDINCKENILPLRKDLHKCFDDRWFAIVPKLTTGGTQYVSHILARQASELWPTYQNLIIRGLTSASKPYLFARFAWAVLLRVKPFVTQGFQRHVIRVHVDNNESSLVEYKEEIMTGIQLQAHYGGGGSKAATPLKRKTDARDELGGLEDDSSEEEAETWDDLWDTGHEQGIPIRSAKRRQQTSSESVPDDKPVLSSADRIALETSIGELVASQSEQGSMEE
ncbi:uncharacterized protein TrAtP1_013210 [Trichoderma atroviride]|uniref:uncharacterized protein n=1 Tax=Hypocrea atroviridis TaxID=63577 RepID=UPI00331783D5|nr:hypothetical protein TrAtP1_013210 [Trichoderma atroviride]